MNGYTTTYGQLPSVAHGQDLTPSSPLSWLRLAWDDAYASPTTSLALGIAFTGLCFLAYTAASAMPVLTTLPLTVLLMVGPFVATAGYFVACQRERGERVSLRTAFSRVRTRALSIGLFSLMMGLIASAWVRLSTIAFALKYGVVGVDLTDASQVLRSLPEAPVGLMFVLATGLLLAGFLFAVSVISLPMVADRNCGPIDAIRFSLRSLQTHSATLLVWMIMLAAGIGAALASSLALMPVVFPLLAYATWHGYRQVSGTSGMHGDTR